MTPDKPLDPTVEAILPTNEGLRRFYNPYHPAVDCHEELDIPVGGGPPAKASRWRVRRGRLG
jgi:hypothetical protein